MQNKIKKNPTEIRTWLLILAMVCLVLFIYSGLTNSSFINIDDDLYVYENSNVINGLSLDGVKWAFTDTKTNHWFPLTWLSLMLDAQIYGMNPGGFHFTNILFHIINSILIFFLFSKLTGEFWKSAAVALLFAVHPLHVESVAWITERKDMLSSMFWAGAIIIYIDYTQKRGIWKYLMCALFFVFSLMSKQMAVTLPFLLLIIDFWPLKRLSYRSVFEKIPLFAIAAAISVATFMIPKTQGALYSMKTFPIGTRIINAVASYFLYVKKSIIPIDLAIFYPYRDGGPEAILVAAGIMLILFMTLFAIVKYKTRPYLAFGWFWFSGTLVPVIGLVQIGSQSMADRFIYFPITGLFALFIWLVADIVKDNKNAEKAALAVFLVVITAFTFTAKAQTQYWKNSITVFERAINVTENNFTAHKNLGVALVRDSQFKRAFSHFQECLRIAPEYGNDIYLNMGGAYLMNFILDFNPDPDALTIQLLEQQIQGLEKSIMYYKKELSSHPGKQKALKGLKMATHAIISMRKIMEYEISDTSVTRSEFLNILKLKAGFMPYDNKIWYYAAKLEASSGRLDRACNYFQKIKDKGLLTKAENDSDLQLLFSTGEGNKLKTWCGK